MADARDVDAALAKTFGARLTEADATKLRASLDAWAKGRGDWMTVAVPWGKDREGVVVRAPAADADAATSAVRGVLDLARKPVLADPLASLLRARAPAFATADVQGFGKAQTATFARDRTTPLVVAWGVAQGEIAVAAAENATTLLPPATSRLGDDPAIARALAAVDSHASAVLFAQPLRLDAARASAQSQPVVVAWGRDGASAWARVQLAGAVVREIIKQAAGF
jgi:hypothetical protein